MLRPGIFVCVLLLLCRPAVAQLPVYDAAREWKTTEGKSFSASLMAFDGKTVTLRLPNGQQWQTAPVKLSPGDLAYLAEWQGKQPIKAEMPEMVGVDSSTLKVEIVSEDAKS